MHCDVGRARRILGVARGSKINRSIEQFLFLKTFKEVHMVLNVSDEFMFSVERLDSRE